MTGPATTTGTLLLAAALVAAPPAATQATPPACQVDGAAPPGAAGVLDLLVGEWAGEGQLFGRPAQFAMTWAPELNGRFLGLSYAIEGGVRMQARAHYQTASTDTLRGVWVDSRGQILELAATLTDAALDTRWRSPTEAGRTVYRAIAADSVEVCDFVAAQAGWRLFGTARYTRKAR